MTHPRYELSGRGRIFIGLILFSLVATVSYLYGLGIIANPVSQTIEKDPEFAPPIEEESTRPPNNNPLSYPLPPPHLLRLNYTDEELQKFIPTGCPALPWRRNLTEQPILIQGHNVNSGGRFSPEGKLLEGCPWPCAYSNGRDWTEVDGHYFEMFKIMLKTDVPIHDAKQYGESHRRVCPLQRYLFFAMEADTYYPVVGDPRAPKFGFDIAMTYKLDSDAPAPYFSDIGYDFFQKPLTFEEKNKTAAYASSFISNCFPTNNRNDYQREIQSLIPVDSFGNCHHTVDVPSNSTLNRWDFKQDQLPKYLFTLAFENSNTKDYVTEKVYQALVAGTVPIYIGAPNIDELVPSPDAIIKASDFESPAKLVDHLKFLRENQTEYERYLEWKKRGPDAISEPFKSSLRKNRIDASCRVCGVLAGEDVGW